MISREVFLAEEEDVPDDTDLEARPAVLRFRHLIAHLRLGRDWARLFQLVEQRGFLAGQADHFGSFERPGADLEEHVLPAAIELGDWERFVRFAAVAINLRAMAEELTDPEILAALAHRKEVRFAENLAAGLADPVRRAEAHSVLAAACAPGDPAFGALLREIAQDLQAEAGVLAADGRTPVAALVAIAQRLGPELDALWPACLARLTPAPGDAARVWRAVAAAWLDRGDIHAPGLWRALAEIGDPRLLMEFAPERLADLELENPWEILGKLRELFRTDEGARQWAFATFLGRLARSRTGPAIAAWKRWTASEDIGWSVKLVEAGREIIARLEPDGLEDLWGRIEDATARAALRVIALESRPDKARAAAALAALREVPAGSLHWSLRYVASRPPEPEEALRRKLDAIAGFLYETSYDVPPKDLRLFLDLISRIRPGALKAALEAVVWSPASRPGLLMTLAAETERVEVSELLRENAERHAAAVARSTAESFQLRKELLFRLTERLCLLRGNTDDLDRAGALLLPDEEDDLRGALAPRLRLRGIAEGIRDRRRRLIARLGIIPSEEIGEELLAAGSLYASFARVHVIEDEIRALVMLHEAPLDLVELVERTVHAISDPGIRHQTILRLAWHSLAFQESFYGGRPDRKTVIEAVLSAFNADTTARLAAFVPEVAELGAQAGGVKAVAEFQAAARRLVHLDSVSWPERRDALERLLAQVMRTFLGAGKGRGASRAAEVLESVAKLPLQCDTGAISEEVQGRWHEILPMLAAVLDRLPEKLAARVRRACRNLLSLPRSPVQRRVVELCLLPPRERLDEVERRWGERDLQAEEIQALPYLLVVPAPENVQIALEQLPVGAERDSLGLRLVQNGWLCPEQALSLRYLFSCPETWQRAEISLPETALPHGREVWCRSLAGLAARGQIDPAAPKDDSMIRRLWKSSSPEHLSILARAVIDALRIGGGQRGEVALRLWVHVRLAPCLGVRAPSDRKALAARTLVALRKALELASDGSTGSL